MKARALVGGTSGEKSLEAAKQFMKLYESTIPATPRQWAFGPPPPPSGPHPSGAEFEVKWDGLLDRFSGSLEQVMQSSLQKAEATKPL